MHWCRLRAAGALQQAPALSSKREQRHVDSRRRRLNTDLHYTYQHLCFYCLHSCADACFPFYLNNTLNLRHLTQRIISCCTPTKWRSYRDTQSVTSLRPVYPSFHCLGSRVSSPGVCKRHVAAYTRCLQLIVARSSDQRASDAPLFCGADRYMRPRYRVGQKRTFFNMQYLATVPW